MRRLLETATMVLIGAAVFAADAAAQDFNWRGRITRGDVIEIKGINGAIHARPSSGNEVRVSAVKSARRSDPDDVEVEVVEHNGGITICAVYPSRRRGEPNECQPGSGGRMNVNDNDVKVEFEVEVPTGVILVARTVNGSVTAEGLTSDVRAHTVNGEIELSTDGLAEAHTVNGSITAVMGRAGLSEDAEFETVNGSIVIEVGGDLNADVRATTVNGGISTDYPLTVQGRFGPKRLSGTIGRGGRNLSLSTVNGSIEIRRR